MTDDTTPDTSSTQSNKYQVGPGFGLFLMGIMYLVFWLMPFTIETYIDDPRWAHNWTYGLIFMTLGASFYQKTVASRIIALIQASLMPLTASGLFNSTLITLIALLLGSLWIIVVLIERRTNTPLIDHRLSRRTQNWVVMHSLIVCWLLLAHMGLVFFIGRLPFEAQLDTIGTSLGQSLGFLLNLPVERYDLVTYVFDVNIIILAILFSFEQFKVGYNPRNESWPRTSFLFLWISIVLGLVLLPFSLQGIIP